MPAWTPSELPAGTRLVLFSEELIKTFEARTNDGARMSMAFGSTDSNGWTDLIVTTTLPDIDLRSEVLFKTSNSLIYDAVHRIYHLDRDKEWMDDFCRNFIRRLDIPEARVTE